MRVPPPAAPPRKELITIHPLASVSESCHSKTISGLLPSNFSTNFLNSSYTILEKSPSKEPATIEAVAPVCL